MSDGRTEAIKRAVIDELERQRATLEAAPCPETLSIILRLDRQGRPQSVQYRTESRRTLGLATPHAGVRGRGE